MNKVQILREVIKKLVPMIASRDIRVTQVGAQAFVQTDTRTLKPVRVNIPHLPDDADDSLVFAIQGFIDHELGHVLDTDWSVVVTAKPKGRALAAKRKMPPEFAAQRMHDLGNLVEDPYVERKMSERFKGAAYNVDKLHDIFIARISKPAIDAAKTPEDRFGCIIVPLVRAWAGQEKFRAFIDDNGYMNDPLVEAFDRLVPAKLKADLKKTRSTSDCMAIAEQLFDIIHPEPPPPPPAPPKPSVPPPPAPPEKGGDEKDQEKSDEQADSEKGEPSDGEGNNQDKPEDEDDKGSDGEQSVDHEKDDDGKESEKAEEGEKPEGDESDAENEPGDGDQGDGSAAGEDDKADEGSEGKKHDAADDDNGDQDDESEDKDDAEGEAGDDGDADDDADADGSAGDSDEKSEDETDENQNGSSSEKDDDDAGEDGEQGEPEAGTNDADGGSESDEGDQDDADGKDSVEGESKGEQKEGDDAEGAKEAQGGGKTQDTPVEDDDDAEATKNDHEEAPESNPFMGTTLDKIGDDLAKGIQFIITNEATRDIRDADYRVYTTDWDVCEKFPVPKIDPNATPAPVGRGRRRNHYGQSPLDVPKLVEKLEELTSKMVAPMQKDIERMMAARSQVVKVPGYRSGRLHSGSLHRLRVGDDRVFRRIEVNKSLETAVTLLIDNSGSMSGAKMKTAMAAGFALSSTLERVKIKHEVMGFTTMQPRDNPNWMQEQEAEEQRIGMHFSRMGALYHPLYKGFDERLSPAVKQRFACAPETCPMGGNTDGESIRFAANRLAIRTEPRKVMIVLSDGNPAAMSHHTGEIYADVHRAVKECDKKGIEIVGLGIMDSAVRTFYPKCAVLNDLSELPKAVMGELKRVLAA